MFNIKPIEIDEEKLLKEIIKLKRDKEIKKCLESKEEKILEAYKNYEINKNNLETIKSLESFQKIKEELKSWYNNDSVKVKRIRKQMLTSTIKCPYCLLSETNVLDHYLQKSSFPEFSVYSKNLIPICSNCNGKKGELFCKNGVRQIINPYYDNLPEYQFLFVDLYCEDGIPVLEKISLKFKDESNLKLIIENHFINLELKDRYKKFIIQALQTKFEILNGNKSLESIEAVKNHLESEIKTLKKQYNCNYWELVLDYAIINNPDVLEAIITNAIE